MTPMRIAAWVYPGALATSITLPLEILQAAGQRVAATRRGEPPISISLAGDHPGLQATATGVQLLVEEDFTALREVDLLVLPAIWRHPRTTLAAVRPALDQLRLLAGQGALVCSVGTGSYLMAEAGLLDGRPATTHWRYFDDFAARYPQVSLQRRHLITQSGHLYCAGSVNSVADLMVHIVDRRFGSAVARAVESQFSPESRHPFRAAAYLEDARSSHHDEAVIRAQHRLESDLSSPPGLEALARQVGLTPRTLQRRFRAATGKSIRDYLHERRIAEARALLQHSDLSVAEIGWQCGWQDASQFARHFRRLAGLSPRSYRTAVRGKRFQTDT